MQTTKDLLQWQESAHLLLDRWEEIQATSPDVQTGGTRGVIGGGNNPSYLADIEFVTISTTGNATDYGDLTDARGALTGLLPVEQEQYLHVDILQEM